MDTNIKDLKYVVCLFQMDGHRTWRMTQGKSLEYIENYLKTQLGKNKVVAKKFIEIDRLTGTFEEF